MSALWRRCPEVVHAQRQRYGYSKSIIYRAAESGGDYLVSLIDLDEGVRLMSSVVGCDVADVKIGMVVRASVDRSGAAARLVFHPAEERA